MNSEKKYPNIYCFPQGIGDFLHVLDRFLIGHLKKNYNPNDIFILQYKQQKSILDYLTNNIHKNIYLTQDLKKKPLALVDLILKILKKKFKYLIIEPNISKNKTLFLSSLIRYQKRISILDLEYNFQKQNKVLNYNKIFTSINAVKNNLNLFDYFKAEIKFKEKFYIGFSAGSGSLEKHKRWPAKHFSNLINKLTKKFEKNIHIYLYGSQEEYDLNLSILNGVEENKKQYLSIFTDFDILNNFKHINNLDLFISNDNGLSHAACLLNVKTICLFGPTNELDHGDFDNRIILRENLSCSPCYHKLRFGCGDEKCLKNLKPDKVFNKILDIVNF